MNLTTFRFFAFAILFIIVYFVVPKKVQWIVLLAASMAFYALAGVKNSFFILITSASTYAAARWIDHLTVSCNSFLKENKNTLPREERKAYKARSVNQRKAILIVTLCINFGILCVFKYANFIIQQVNHILRAAGSGEIGFLYLLVPLGISFYTFTSMGYLLDVYWEKAPAQTNYLKMLLFVSFFPQITQGPISDYRQLSGQLYAEHPFDYKNFSWGVQRFLWGLVKKLVIASISGKYSQALFASYPEYSGISTFIAILFYALQIYADFSGYMDMMCGLCQILGIELAENFERPYFSKSISEYWRRWHITLGAWFKNYIYYPVGFSRFATSIGKKGQKALGDKFAKDMPATIALIVVWFTTGLWHGANWGYIIWGLVNGMFVIATLWLEPVYARMRQFFHIRETSGGWRAFQVLRTFVLISFIKILPEVGGLRAGLNLWAQVVRGASIIPHTFAELLPFVDDYLNFAVILIFTVILFIFSLIERRKPVREAFNKWPMILRVFILALFFVIAILFGARADGLNGAFLYAQF
ncbi:MAG: MBOAT family protein [Parasporobacterium sp.]|nr:MBOAT family protein [Parasporobacterium sp.]